MPTAQEDVAAQEEAAVARCSRGLVGPGGGLESWVTATAGLSARSAAGAGPSAEGSPLQHPAGHCDFSGTVTAEDVTQNEDTRVMNVHALNNVTSPITEWNCRI